MTALEENLRESVRLGPLNITERDRWGARHREALEARDTLSLLVAGLCAMPEMPTPVATKAAATNALMAELLSEIELAYARSPNRPELVR